MFCSLNTAAAASGIDQYYGPVLDDLLYSPNITSSEIKDHLHQILKSTHKAHSQKPEENQSKDIPLDSLSNKKHNKNQRAAWYYDWKYKKARKHLFRIDIKEDTEGYHITSFYCGYEFHSKNIASIKPGKLPSPHIVNTEHLWPQSHFTDRQSKNQQKTDLHHLRVTASRINSTRGNRKFGEIENPTQEICTDTFIGKRGSIQTFQPAPQHRGNIARSLFYFSIRYKVNISPQEEEFLRKWHEEDPVDEEEWNRHQAITEIQKNRNPFIDHPELEARINNF